MKRRSPRCSRRAASSATSSSVTAIRATRTKCRSRWGFSRHACPAVAKSLTEPDWEYLEALPLFLRLPGLIVVHAGLVPGIALEKQEEAAMISMRSLDAEGRWSKRIDAGAPWASKWPGPERVVFGHDAVRGLQKWPHATGLDSGCVYGRKLTGLLWPEDRLISVPAHKTWVSMDD